MADIVPSATRPSAAETGEIAILDDMRPVKRFLALGGVFFVAGAVILPLLVITGISYWAAWLLGLMFFVIGGGLVLVTLPRFFHRATPFLVITEEGFRCPGLADPLVPWSSVEYGSVVGDSPLTTNFFLKPDAALPVRDGSRNNVKVLRRRRAVSIRGPEPRGMTPQDYGALIGARIAAADPDLAGQAGSGPG